LLDDNTNTRSKVAGVPTCIFMNDRHDALAHRTRPGLRFGYACWPQPAPWETLHSWQLQITLDRLVNFV